MWSANPNLTREDVISFLQRTAYDLGESGADAGYGFGRLELPEPSAAVNPGEARPPARRRGAPNAIAIQLGLIGAGALLFFAGVGIGAMASLRRRAD